ncbi:MAG TPA: DUF748 domain-containing protein [Steroidobacteraceae bacterium]
MGWHRVFVMNQLRFRRLLLWVVLPLALLVLLYAGLGFLAVPRLLRSGVQDYASQHYHRAVAVGDIRFNPFTLRLDIGEFSLPDTDGQPMVAFRHLMVDLTIASLWRLGPDFQAIVLQQPYARVVIRSDGTLNLKELAPAPAPNVPARPASGPGRLFIKHLSVQGGNLAFQDHAHPSVFSAQIEPINFDLRNFSTLSGAGGTYSLSASSDAGERLSWSGSLAVVPLSSHGQFEVANLQAHTLWNYLRDSVHFELPSGTVSLHGDYDFTAATSPIGLTVNVHDVTVSDLALRPKGGSEDYVKLDKLEVRETRADLAKRSVTVGSVHLAGGTIRAWVQRPGQVNLLELAGPAQPPPPSATPAAPPSAPTSGPPAPPAAPAAAQSGTPAAPDAWTVSVPDIVVDGVKVSAEDRQVSPAVAVQLDGLRVHLTGLGLPRTAPLAASVSTQINRDGKLDLNAEVHPDSSIKLHGELSRLDLTALQPYIAAQTDMTLRSGFLSAKLDVGRSADGQLSAAGDAELLRLHTVDNELKRDFIKLERLQLSGIDFASKPRSLHVHSIIARAPYARVIVESDRTVNLAKVLRLKSASAPPSSAAASGGAEQSAKTTDAETASASEATASAEPAATASAEASAASANAAAPVKAPSQEAASTTAAVATSGSAEPVPPTQTRTSAAAPPGGSSRPQKHRSHGHRHDQSAPPEGSSDPTQMAIAIDDIRIEDGSANYADFWIQPHFAVGIQTLHGTITGLKSDPRARAKVELKGNVDRYAPVHIWGEVNPLAATAYSDLNLSFKGVELSTVTPYSGHFAGYKIEKGKLSVDISYKIENRQLSAQHRFVIDQLELGDRVESPDAVKLPLKIAVALLKDRNGVINVDLPVTGSLDNPQFRLGPLIWKAVLGLLSKVATAPFAALGHLFGGGAQMKYVDFGAGSAVLDPPEHDKLSTLAKALKEKTQLELDVPVTFSSDLDRPALATARLDRQLLELGEHTGGSDKSGRRKQAAGDHAERATGASQNADDSTSALQSDPALTDPGSRFHLLVALYRQELGKNAPLPESAQEIVTAKKKEPPPDFGAANTELQAALLPRVSVSDSQLEALGRRRAQAIQDALLSGGELDPARVFIIGSAPKTEVKDKVRVELSLK